MPKMIFADIVQVCSKFIVKKLVSMNLNKSLVSTALVVTFKNRVFAGHKARAEKVKSFASGAVAFVGLIGNA